MLSQDLNVDRRDFLPKLQLDSVDRSFTGTDIPS